MKKILAPLAATLVALFGLVALAPQAAQAHQQATAPEIFPPITIHIGGGGTVVSGKNFTITINGPTCTAMSLNFLGQTASSNGPSVTGHFTAPTVSKPTDFPLIVTCTFPAPSAKKGMALAVKMQTLSRTVQILVQPTGSGTGGTTMPNTGGPSAWLWIAGLGALALGGVTMIFGRRRTSSTAL